MRSTSLPTLLLLLASASLPAQDPSPSRFDAKTFEGLALRGIGPAFMSGRIADIAIHPTHDHTWYIAVGSGGVFKTTNAGVTWTPLFDKQKSYSIGCVTIDPHNPHRVWVGTGENIGGRHVGFGDGVYRSEDGGKTWKNVGLPRSEHIAEIIVHPKNPQVLWVASQGPLWKKGGERGVYRTEDGGKTWRRTLGDDWVGATELCIDPRNPDRLYAATWQRHRTVAAYLGGGPGSGLHRSEDGGRTWQKLTEGLPESNLGKIGLAISPAQPDVLYAAIELDRRKGGVFRSTNRGASWEKRSDTVSGGTGPHYYQELYACPHRFDRIYLADVRIRVSEDGGKSFRKMAEKHKHSDNHAMAFKANDPDYLLVGCDGGLYESFDLAKNWRFFANLPLTQFYKIALDDSAPFYNVYGGTQDNATEGGPSRTDNFTGIRNSDWRLVLDWDGHQPATEPGNPRVLYAERQEGHLARIDTVTGEVVDIQPQAAEGDPHERYNWDAPILVSPHQPTRIYFASYRVWRSDNRGNSWQAISGDLTRNQNRFDLPVMGAKQSWDNAWDVNAMSNFNTITSLAESPRAAGLLYAGTDDGLVQVTEDGGKAWRKVEVGAMPGVPKAAFVNDIKADLFAADTVYVALDNHKEGDFAPYLMRSDDRGRSWRSITGNLPKRTLVWRLVQDHVRKDLLFAATEFGIYFTVDGGAEWTQLSGGVPTISFRDLAIHRRDDDLVGASFGRGIFILDDLSPLRSVSASQLADDATLFQPRKAWWYIPRSVLGFESGKGDQGAGYYTAPNPPFGAVFTYYLRDGWQTRARQRAEKEKAAGKAKQPVAFPGWKEVEAERRESAPRIWFAIQDADGHVIRRIEGKTEKGFHRTAWDLRYPTPNAIELVAPPPPEWGLPPRGLMVAPGRYSVTMSVEVDGTLTTLGKPMAFDVVPLRPITGADPAEVAAFWRSYEAAVRNSTATQVSLARLLERSKRMGEALRHSRAKVGAELDQRYHALRKELLALDYEFNGDRSRQAVGEKHHPTPAERLLSVSRGIEGSTTGPTQTNKQSLAIANQQITKTRAAITAAQRRMTALGKELIAAGAPWIEGGPLPEVDRK